MICENFYQFAWGNSMAFFFLYSARPTSITSVMVILLGLLSLTLSADTSSILTLKDTKALLTVVVPLPLKPGAMGDLQKGRPSNSQLPQVGLASVVHVAQGALAYAGDRDNPAALPALGACIIQSIAALIQTALHEKQERQNHHHQHHNCTHHHHHRMGTLELCTSHQRGYTIILIGDLVVLIHRNKNFYI